MLKGLSIGMLFVVLFTNSSFASINNTTNYLAKIMPAFTIDPGVTANKYPQMQLVLADATIDNNQALINSIAFKNILRNVAKLPVAMKAAEDKELSFLQVKYAERLNEAPELLNNISLLESLDYWYGTRYVYGGTTKKGIDCSAFVRAMYESVYGIELPRTARAQYSECRRVSTTELQEGDLVFFNTRGGVSHVGIYLRNNKFAHSSSGRGVVISDLFENYYVSHYIGAGRVLEKNNHSLMAKN